MIRCGQVSSKKEVQQGSHYTSLWDPGQHLMAGGEGGIELDLEEARVEIGFQDQIIRAREHGFKFI